MYRLAIMNIKHIEILITVPIIILFFIEIRTLMLVESFVVLLVELFLQVDSWFAIDVGFDKEAEVLVYVFVKSLLIYGFDVYFIISY